MHRGIAKACSSRLVLVGLVVALQVTLTVAIIAAFQYQATNAAPASSIEACINRYTGAVRMSPYGATTCNANESQVMWSAVDTDTHGVGDTSRVSVDLTIPANTTSEAVAHCPAGYVATGGGFESNGWTSIIFMDSKPTVDGTGWHVVANNPDASPRTGGVNVVCARP